MARYRLKRYSAVTDMARNTIGGVAQGVGSAMDTKIGGLAGGLAGGSLLGATLSPLLAGIGPLGWLAGAAIGAGATRGLGKGLKSAGQDMQY